MAHVIACLALVATLGCGDNLPRQSPTHVIAIDIDDHGLSGLSMANAPNLQGLISRGTLGFSRVVIPTHSNQNNIALLTGQYPEGNDVPANSWLSRASGYAQPVDLPGLGTGDYVFYDRNPLLTRGDSAYRAIRDAGLTSAYVGQLPPFEAGAGEVHLSIIGASLGGVEVTPAFAQGLLTRVLRYPTSVASGYHLDGPPAAGESQAHFTLRDAASFVRATSLAHPMPAFLFVWAFLALDGNATETYGADGPELVKVIRDYDDGVGLLLSALAETGLLDSTNIVFTLDHGKVDTHKQVVLGTQGGGGTTPADGQLAALVSAQGPALGLGLDSYAVLNEDGDGQIYARVDGAGTAAGSAAETDVTHRLLSLIQSGAIVGLDTTRTMTADGALGTLSFHDFHASGPNQPDILVFPSDDWTLNQVDPTNSSPGPFQQHTEFPYGRHGGFSIDELYVPIIMAGPAFKAGALLPHPVEHPEVPATALWTVGGTRLATAARGPIAAALAGDPGETIAQPALLETARDLVLGGGGFLPVAAPASTAPSAAILIDAAGLYDEEVFGDPALAGAAAPLRALAAQGVRFEDFWARSRDWPVTEYQLLTGGYPVDPWVPAAEDDSTQTLAPGNGLLQMPPAPGRVANQAGYEAWRSPDIYAGAGDTLFDAAHDAGMTTALIGQLDFHDLHVDASRIDQRSVLDGPAIGARLSELVAAFPRLLAVIAVGGARTANRHAPAAIAELADLSSMIADLAARAAGALVVITSRGGTSIDDDGSDFYGPGSSRHVPLMMVGPNVRAGVVSGEPGAPADIPATMLLGLGAATTSDLALGTWAAGAPLGGAPRPRPAHATEGRALVRAFRM